MTKSLEEVYSDIQHKRSERKKTEESIINELKLIQERQHKIHMDDRRRLVIYTGGSNRNIKTQNSYVDDYVDDYLL